MTRKIRPDVLEDIQTAQDIFRARGRPLPPEAVDELASAWLLARREFDPAGEVTADFWAIAELQDLHHRAPQSAWAVLDRLLELEPGDWMASEVLDEVMPLWELHPAITLIRLPEVMVKYPGLKQRLWGPRPYGWQEESWARLRECLEG